MKKKKRLLSYDDGGTIHIKPENRSKFNATKARTGKTTEELTHSPNPLTRKRAIFAQNAAKWNHADGGTVELPKYGTGSTVGGAAGFAAGQALNLVVPGLGTVAAPLTAAGGAWLGDKIENKWFGQEEGDQEAELAARNRMMGLDNVGLMSPTVQTNTNPLYAYGGHTGPNAEIEDKELVQLPKGRPLLYNGGRLNQQSMDTYAADGLTHEQGGMDTGLPEGTRVFSDRIKHNGRTIASLAKPIANKIGQLEKKNDNPATKFTIDRLKLQQDSLFSTQEAIKGEQEMKKKYKLAKGGLIKYQYGGGLDPEDPNYVPPELGGSTNRFDTMSNDQYNNLVGGQNQPNLNMAGYSGTPGESVTNNATNFGSYAPLAAAGVSAIGSLIQSRNINKTPAPAKIQAIDAPMIDPFSRVDLTQERVDLNRDARSGRSDVLRNSGSFATQASNLGKIRASQLMGRGNINMREQNANTQIDNAYKQASAEIRNRNVTNQQAVNQQNMENQYNYNLWKTGQKNAVTSNLTGTGVNLLNNETQHQNQLEYYDALAQGYTPGILDRNKLNPRKKAKGGLIKSSKK